ncbi:MAG: serine hydrolase [Candidatus Marinimicrobia bacterium]|nr:serine hydrolase [Candidatus Neomarinimicrobiota bacterium]
MFIKKLYCLPIALLVLSSCTVSKDSRTDPSEFKIQQVENGLLPAVLIEGEPSFNLEERMEDYQVPGVSVAVIKDYKILWSKGYGVLDAETQQPVTVESIFNVGSLSKGVASITALTLVADGSLDMYRDVNKQLTSWQLPENDFLNQGIVTPLLLLNHSSGVMFSPSISYLPDNLPSLLQMLNGEPPAKEKQTIVDKIPGTVFQYSNPGFAILQQVCIDVSGQPFPSLADQRIFKPLKMEMTTFEQPVPEVLLSHASAGHLGNSETLPNKRYLYPNMAAGGLWSTPSDYARYVIEIQKAAVNQPSEVLSSDLAQQMISPHAARNYGLGVFLRDMGGEQHYFGHMGDNRGFFAGYIAHMTDGHGAVIFTNSLKGSALIREIMRSIATAYSWENYLPPTHTLLPLDQEMAKFYSGRYTDGFDESFQIRHEGSSLFIDKFDNARLYPVEDNQFVTKFRDGHLKFMMDSETNAVTVEHYFADNLGRFMQDARIYNKMLSDEKLPSELMKEGGIEQAVLSYRNIWVTAPQDLSISENRLNRLGYWYLGQQLFERAIAVFLLNVEFYPESANCYDSLAEAYMKSGQNELAIIYYKKVLELDPVSSNAILMLKQLGVIY